MSEIVPLKIIPSNPQSPKNDPFFQELNELLTRYQFRLHLALSFSPSGVFPTLSLVDFVPPKPEAKIIKNKKTKNDEPK